MRVLRLKAIILCKDLGPAFQFGTAYKSVSCARFKCFHMECVCESIDVAIYHDIQLKRIEWNVFLYFRCVQIIDEYSFHNVQPKMYIIYR